VKELLLIIARNLVEKPDAVAVDVEERDNTTVLKLKVAPEDMGKVIGKQGRIAKAIRTVVKAAAIHDEGRVQVEIVQ
jgi:predicted RNA-binding protein YlqC (UPF0109 family)